MSNNKIYIAKEEGDYIAAADMDSHSPFFYGLEPTMMHTPSEYRPSEPGTVEALKHYQKENENLRNRSL